MGNEQENNVKELHDKTCKEGKSFYLDPETKSTVFTRNFLLERGHCCESSCRHCPYGFKYICQEIPLL